MIYILRDKAEPFHQDAIDVCEGKIACLLRFMHAITTHPSSFKESFFNVHLTLFDDRRERPNFSRIYGKLNYELK